MRNEVSLTGGRTVLATNVCALVFALIVSAEGIYIDLGVLGRFRASDFVAFFLPTLVMFIIRNKSFSFIFLFFYAALAIQMWIQAYNIHSGTYNNAGAKDPLGFAAVFFFLSVVCLAIYGAIALVKLVLRRFALKRMSEN